MATHSLTPDDLDYPLPEDRIATRPAEPRDSARMMVVHVGGDEVEHAHVRDLAEYLRADDLMVFNDTRVLPARLVGRRADTGGRVEGLYLESETPRDLLSSPTHPWRAMLKSNGRLRTGLEIELLDHHGHPTGFTFTLREKHDESWLVESPGNVQSALAHHGWTPLPPYILRSRGRRGAPEVDDAADRAWYQTVYADPARAGSVAAPTAGLHFTDRLLSDLSSAGIGHARVTLHVGPGTFKPVTATTLAEHTMHHEWYEISELALNAMKELRSGEGGRLAAVGTTTVRTLESLPVDLESTQVDPATRSVHGTTDLLIAPPYTFRHVDVLLTNFHLPRSTLLALVAAMVGLDRLKALYAEAVARGYRFYSYGDAMLILP